MIGSLRGRVLDRSGTEVLVEVAGVGYRVQVTPRTLAAAVDVDDDLFLWVHHHRREDAETLYGFDSRDERDVFESLIGTHGVGPSLGLAMLSVHSPGALRRAVATEDVAALCLVPGVGKKTAARLLVELSSRLDLGVIDLGQSPTPGAATVVGGSPHGDVRDALAGLGYSPDEILAATADLPADSSADVSELLRMALQRLATPS